MNIKFKISIFLSALIIGASIFVGLKVFAAVKSAYLISSTFDTGAAGGVVYNALLYQGSKPTGTQVGFQFATSDSANGPWSFKGYDNSDTTYYTPTGPNVPIALNSGLHNNKRYFRYKIFLDSNISQTATPQVDDIIVTWSR